MKSFVVNPKLMNPLIKLIFKKTSIYDSASVMKCMDISSQLFFKLDSKDIQIPSDFDFNFFMKGLELLLTADHSTNTAKAVWLLYQIVHILPQNERENLLVNLMKPNQFYKFMFHWSWFVRKSFHYFYYFQCHRLFLDNKEAVNEMRSAMS